MAQTSEKRVSATLADQLVDGANRDLTESDPLS